MILDSIIGDFFVLKYRSWGKFTFASAYKTLSPCWEKKCRIEPREKREITEIRDDLRILPHAFLHF